MAAVKLKVTGQYTNTLKYLERMHKLGGSILQSILNKIGYEGVKALYEATPKRTGKTASSWEFVIKHNGDKHRIVWRNTNIVKGDCIAMLIQYGHGTKGGGYVPGIDYINPALDPVFKRAAKAIVEEVKKDAGGN